MPEFEEIFKLLVIVAALPAIPAVLYLGYRWARAGIRMLEVENEQKAGDGGKLAAEVDSLRGRLADLEDSHARLTELEERIDFTERLLARQQEPRQVNG